MTGDLRIGLKESLVEAAIARAFGSTMEDTQRTNMLVGDIGETVRLAAEGKLSEAQMRLFHPLGFMLASPIESPEEGLSYFPEAAVEDKYDGIRAQAHVSGGEVKLFSRTRDEITESFPELPDALAGLPRDAILDGEIVAWDTASRKRARPFSVLQQRLGRKKVSDKMLREISGRIPRVSTSCMPTANWSSTVRCESARKFWMNCWPRSGPLAKAQSREERPDKDSCNLERMTKSPQPASFARLCFAPHRPTELEELFAAAQARGNEGLMIKDLNSPYTPGKRGKSWLKMKRELATLDVVVTAVEYGHGKRVGVLSDYTFAVWDTNKDRLVNIGKAYSGLTDTEIGEMTKWFLENTIEDQGFRRVVEPKIVLEVAFNNMMRSDRHDSGYALRFPRIVRLRPDKSPEEADTIERAKEIYDKQV